MFGRSHVPRHDRGGVAHAEVQPHHTIELVRQPRWAAHDLVRRPPRDRLRGEGERAAGAPIGKVDGDRHRDAKRDPEHGQTMLPGMPLEMSHGDASELTPHQSRLESGSGGRSTSCPR